MVPWTFLRAYTRRCLLAALGALALVGGACANTGQGIGLDAPYAVQASNQTLTEVLDRFSADHGLTLSTSGPVKAGWRTAKLDGWLRASTGRAFLEQLAHAHRFSWFIVEPTLYLSGTRDSSVERIPLNGLRADDARTALEAVGIYDGRFGWGALAGQDVVLVGGPRAYRAIVRRFLAGQSPASTARATFDPMFFPLRFARAGDTSPPSGAMARPGVATLLRQLLARETPAAQPAFSTAPRAEAPPPLPGVEPSLAQWTGYPSPASIPLLPTIAAPSLPFTSEGGRSKAAPIGIIADDRTNTVIVWADPALRPAIEKLIEAFDRASSLVSIDLFVIESDGTTVDALSTAGESAHASSSANSPTIDDRFAEAIAAHRARLLNRQTLVGPLGGHITLTIGGETAQTPSPPGEANASQGNGRNGNRGDRLDLVARVVPSEKIGVTAIAVDIDLLLAQPTGLPGQTWTNSSGVKLDTIVTVDSGAPPRLIASYPVATARAEQRAIFIRAKAL